MEPNRDPPVVPCPAELGSTPPGRGFESTHWSVVVQAQDPAAPQARAALATLCQTYWYPIYAHFRRKAGSADEAEELTQEFFARFLEKGVVGGAEPAKGKFRTYLLACCDHFLANHRRQARALKRGGGQYVLSLDLESGRERYDREPADTLPAEKLFDRRWALTLLEQGLDRLAKEYRDQGKGALYDQLKGHLIGDPGAGGYAAVAGRLGMTDAAVKKAAQRLRERCRAVLREHILATVAGPGQVEDEVRELFSVLGG